MPSALLSCYVLCHGRRVRFLRERVRYLQDSPTKPRDFNQQLDINTAVTNMPFPGLRMLLLLCALAFLMTLVQLDIVTVAFEKLGLSRDTAYLLLVTTLIGSRINVPLFSISMRPVASELPEERIPGYSRPPQIPRTDKTVIAVNVGGCVIPVVFSIYLLTQSALSAPETSIAVATVALVAYLSSRPMPGVGVAMPLLLAPATAALVAVILNDELSAPLAYVGGTLGVLVGADLFRLSDVRSLGAPVASIGGAGTFDGVFITGLLAVLLT